MTIQVSLLSPEFDLFEDDTEETLVGSSIHQGAITVAVQSIDDCAIEHGLPWFVGNQITLVMPRQGDRPPAQPAPDICVHPTLTRAPRTSLLVAIDGPPSLIIEVTSPSTALGRDLNVGSPTGKPLIYEAMGIAEYLVFDPLAEYLGQQIWARRLGPHGYLPWEPAANGRWVSETLGIAFAPQGFLLRVYNRNGLLVPLYGDLRSENLDLHDRLAEERHQRAAERQRLAELEAELRRLRGE
jgi:Uma2 family endonuclease